MTSPSYPPDGCVTKAIADQVDLLKSGAKGEKKAAEHRVGRRVVVSLDARPRRTEDGIDILPVRHVCERLWGHDLVGRR